MMMMIILVALIDYHFLLFHGIILFNESPLEAADS